MIALFSMGLVLTGCSNRGPEVTGTPLENTQNVHGTSKQKEVTLTLRGAKQEQEMMQELLDSFCEEYKSQANINIVFNAEDENTCQKELLADPQQAPDIFIFPDDQLKPLIASGLIEPVENKDELINQFTPEVLDTVMINDSLYAYPLTADNGFFLYYNNQYFDESDVHSMDRILEVAKNAGKKISMEIDNAWYFYTFFGAKGLELGLNSDGITNHCNWNSVENETKGIDIANGIYKLIKHEAFVNLEDKQLVKAIEDGTVIAAINGIWNSNKIQKAWKDNFEATKLPTYTVNEKQQQMVSFIGYRFVGINAYSEQKQWAAKLAEWLVNEGNQQKRYDAGQIPCNMEVVKNADYSKNPVAAALLMQQEYAVLQRVGNQYWNPVKEFGEKLLNTTYSQADLQYELDTMVEAITAQ